MGRYWRIYRTFFRSSLVRELEFKANFFAKIAQNATWFVFFLLIILVIYRNTDNVAGWSRGEAFLLGATWFFMNALISAFSFTLMELPEQVRRGALDYVVTKPVDAQFWVTLRRFNFDQLGALAASVAMIGIGVWQSGHTPALHQWLAYAVLALCAAVICYSFNLALMTLAIWLVRVDNLWVLSETLTGIARYPLDIYSTGLQRLLTFGVPLAFLAFVPARQLVAGFDGLMLALGLAWALGFFIGARAFFRFAMLRYTSASS